MFKKGKKLPIRFLKYRQTWGYFKYLPSNLRAREAFQKSSHGGFDKFEVGKSSSIPLNIGKAMFLRLL
jgi:hypothetical protein